MKIISASFILIFLTQSVFAITKQADYILVEKTKHTLTLFKNNEAIKIYRVAIGRGGLGQKDSQGDNRTPEGIYKIDYRNPNSLYYKSLHIGYPNPSDTTRIRQQGNSPGGDIMLHGIKNGLGWLGKAHHFIDWTKGCIAISNAEIDEIWQLVPDGITIEIRK